MAQWLKQSTIAVIPFGPFLDKGNGADLESGAGIITSIDDATTGIMLSKNGGALTIRHQAVTPSTYDAHGCFLVTLDDTDTDTLGRLRMIHTEPTTYLAVWQDFMVVTANTWDSLFGTDYLDVAVIQQGGGAIAWTYTLTDADTGALLADVSVWVTSDSAGATVIASGTTNDSGVVTFYLDAGTYYFWRSRAGYNFTNPDTEIVA